MNKENIIAPNEAWEKIKNGALVLDVRTSEEFNEGHLENAVHIPYDELDTRLGEISNAKEREIVVYCRSGKRADVAAQILKEGGFKLVFNGVGYSNLAKI